MRAMPSRWWGRRVLPSLPARSTFQPASEHDRDCLHRDEQPARVATLSVGFSPVTLAPPRRKANQPTLAAWTVEARELRPPKEVIPILWRLVTTLPVTCTRKPWKKWRAMRSAGRSKCPTKCSRAGVRSQSDSWKPPPAWSGQSRCKRGTLPLR